MAAETQRHSPFHRRLNRGEFQAENTGETVKTVAVRDSADAGAADDTGGGSATVLSFAAISRYNFVVPKE